MLRLMAALVGLRDGNGECVWKSIFGAGVACQSIGVILILLFWR